MEENVTVLETPEVVKHTGAEWYQKISLKESDIFIRSNMQSAVRNVIATGYFLKHIRDNQLYLEDGYQNVNEFAMDRYGFSASTVSRYIARNMKFSKGGNSPYIDEKFKEFNKSQLQEMLGISDEQLEQVTPDMTVREIRSLARPKEIPYIEIPGQTELKDIPGVMPEEKTESFEASTAELFDVEEDENMVQAVTGKPISQEIPVAELMEEEDAEIATSQLLPEETAANEQRNKPVDAAEKQQMGHCLHRPEYECSLPKEYMHRSGSGTDCAHECCWECVKHGECKLECNLMKKTNYGEFKKSSEPCKMWLSLVKDIKHFERPKLFYYFDMLLGNSWKERLFAVGDKLYCSIERDGEINTPDFAIEMKASEFYKIIESIQD